ncbi:MAG: type IX secretion system membrane protein PorP/SprF [Bacteroidales bacterium]
MPKKTFVTFIAACLLFGIAKGQSLPDAHFSQFYGAPIYLNPALAGSNICPRINFSYRNQWPAMNKSFITYSASYDQHIEKLSGGIGLNVIADRAGDGLLNTNMINAMYAFRLRVGTHIFMNMALQGSYIQTTLDWNNLQFGEQIDPNSGFDPSIGIQETPPDNNSIGFPDFSAGLSISYKGSIYGGVAVHHLTEPDNSFYSGGDSKLYMKMTAHGGAMIDLEGKDPYDDDFGSFSISPNFMYQQQFNFHQLNVGMYATKLPFILGVWFRHNFENVDAITPMAGFEYRSLKIGYSYDITLSQLKSVSGGAHEVSLAWHFNCIEKRRRIKAINCPRF